MLYMMPLMTGIIALRFPAGLAVYWVATTLFSLVQQYFVSGLGGLEVIINKLTNKK
jgi:YidC/Oxa1 family membrane protein insertase